MGGGNIRDVSRGAMRRALLWGFGGMPPVEIFLNGAIWCVLVYIWIRFCLYKKNKKKTTIFYIIFFKLHFFL